MKAFKHEVPMKDDTRLALLEQSIGHISESLLRIEKRFDVIELKIDRSEIDLRSDIENIRKGSWSQFRWLMGTLIAFLATMLAVLFKGHIP